MSENVTEEKYHAILSGDPILQNHFFFQTYFTTLIKEGYIVVSEKTWENVLT